MKNNKEYYDFIDLLKTIAIIMVIFLHIPVWNVDFIATNNISNIIQYWMRVACEGVPIFLTVNGFLIFKKNNLDYVAHRKKIIKMIILFFLWAIILSLIKAFVHNEAISIFDLVRYIVNTTSGSKYTGVLWFLQQFIGLYLFVPFLWQISNNNSDGFMNLFIIIFLLTIGIDTIELIRDIFPNNLSIYNIINDCINFVNRFNILGKGAFLLYFLLGGAIVHYQNTINSNKRILIIIGLCNWFMAFLYGYIVSKRTGVLVSAGFNYFSLFMVMFIIGLFALASGYKNHGSVINQVITKIGTNSFGIYFVHTIIIDLINSNIFINSLLGRITTAIIVLIISTAISSILSKNKYLKELIKL